MKLSEAIREGAKRRPQTQNTFFSNGASCALGAAYEHLEGFSALMYDSEDIEFELIVKFPVLEYAVQSPVDAEMEDSLFNIISDLNDVRNWTREQIADWVETVEQQSEFHR